MFNILCAFQRLLLLKTFLYLELVFLAVYDHQVFKIGYFIISHQHKFYVQQIPNSKNFL